MLSYFLYSPPYFIKIIRNESELITITVSICISTFLIGLLIELIQPYFGRHQSLIDLGYDLIGSLAAGAHHWWKRVKARGFRLTLFLLCACLFSLSSYLPLSKLNSVLQRYQGLPVLMNFDRAWEGEIRRFNPSTKFRVVSPPAT